MSAKHGTDPERAASQEGNSSADQSAMSTVDGAMVKPALAERKKLISLCLYALDRARSSGVADRLEQGLAEVGVTALRPTGERFDPTYHEAGGTIPTDDPTLIGRIAETEVIGFMDYGQPVRAPIVTVYVQRNESA